MKLRPVAGVIAYAKPHRALCATIAAAGALLPAMAAADTPTQVGGVQVEGQRQAPLQTAPTDVAHAPQSVTVITGATLQAQGVSTLEQALRNVPGITIAVGEGGTLAGDQFKIRGFDAKDDIYIDGLRDFGAYTRDSFDYDSVQVLRGPSGALFGRGTTGGAINIVSKTPGLERFNNLTVIGGSANYARVLVDSNMPIGPTSAFRLNLMAQSNNVVDRDRISSRRWGAAAAFAMGIGTDTRFTFNYLHQHNSGRPDYGITIVQPPGQLIAMPASSYDVGVPRSSFSGSVQDYDRSTADIVTARLAHEISPSLSVTSDARFGNFERAFAFTNIEFCFDETNNNCSRNLFDNNPATLPLALLGGQGPYRQHGQGLQDLTTVRWDTNLGSLKTTVIGGLDVSYQRNQRQVFAYTLPDPLTSRDQLPRNLLIPANSYAPGFSVYLPTPANLCPVAHCTATATGLQYTRTSSVDVGGFVTARVYLLDALSVIGSVRYDHYEAAIQTTLFNGTVIPINTSTDVFSPRVSLIYQPTNDFSLYATWNRSATPPAASLLNVQTVVTAVNSQLDPERSESYEAGVRLGVLGGRLTLSASAFTITKNNATQLDNSTGFYLAQSGERQRVSGFELQATGRLTANIQIDASYTHLDSEILQAFVNCAATSIPCGAGPTRPVLNTFFIGRPVAYAPPDAASLWTVAAWPQAGGLETAIGVSYQSAVNTGYFVTNTGSGPYLQRIARIPENFSLDGMIGYRVGRYHVSVNGYNLTDRLNYAQIFNERGTPAPGRSFVVSLTAQF